jgi:hypothetical protein
MAERIVRENDGEKQMSLEIRIEAVGICLGPAKLEKR